MFITRILFASVCVPNRHAFPSLSHLTPFFVFFRYRICVLGQFVISPNFC
nr:MAG TPA_asm: hypothetical protein [Caudoviricetes sp.]